MDYSNHPKMKHIYIGIDCHKLTHTAAVINPFNEKLDVLTFNNTPSDFEKLINMVNKYTTDEITPIYGLEDTKHLGHALSTFLLNNNCKVYHVYSSLTYNERKKFPTISKTDEIDALCIAKVTLDSLYDLPEASNEDIYWTLKQIVKMKSSIIVDNVKAKNKLHAQLLHHYPNYKQFFFHFDCISALEFWETYPSPNLLQKLSVDDLYEFLHKYSKGALKKDRAQKIYDLVHDNIYEEIDYQEERNLLIVMLVKQIKNNNKQIEEIEKTMLSLYDKLDLKLHTMNCLTKMTSAEIVAEIGDINRFSSSDKLARYAGVAPISFSSGGHDKNIRNQFGNRRLNSKIFNLAIRSIAAGKDRDKPNNAIFIEYYHRKISEGKNKQQALTCVMRRLINIIYRMLKNNSEFYMPKDLEEKCKKVYLEKLEEEKEKEKNTKSSVKSTNL